MKHLKKESSSKFKEKFWIEPQMKGMDLIVLDNNRELL